jgi:predicted nucleic acid-binding protein
MMRVLLDTNVVLDSLLRRPPWHVVADRILEATRQRRLSCEVTTLTIANLFYVGRRLVGRVRARTDVRTCLETFGVLGVSRATLDAADAMPGRDFEDNIQIAAAQAAGLDAIVTRDPGDFVASPVPVLSPQHLLAELARQEEAI